MSALGRPNDPYNNPYKDAPLYIHSPETRQGNDTTCSQSNLGCILPHPLMGPVYADNRHLPEELIVIKIRTGPDNVVKNYILNNPALIVRTDFSEGNNLFHLIAKSSIIGNFSMFQFALKTGVQGHNLNPIVQTLCHKNDSGETFLDVLKVNQQNLMLAFWEKPAKHGADPDLANRINSVRRAVILYLGIRGHRGQPRGLL